MSSVTFGWKSGRSPEALERKFDRLDDAIEENLEDAMDTVVTKIAADASQNAPYETGWLSGHIRGIVLGWVGDVLEGAVGTNVEYGQYHEEGRDSFTIKPEDAEYLHFKVNGNWVRTKSVEHPGIEKNPFLQPAIDENRDWAEEQFEQAIEDAVNEVFG